jgi:hypothetical protein
MSTFDALIARAASRYVAGSSWRIRQRTSGPYGRAAPGSSIAAPKIFAVGSAAFTAAARSAVNVAMPQRRGTEDATKAMRINTIFPTGRSFGGTLDAQRAPLGDL